MSFTNIYKTIHKVFNPTILLGGCSINPTSLRVKTFVDCLIYVSKRSHTEFGTPRTSPSCIKVCGGVGGWVCKPILVIDLGPFPSSGQSIKGDSDTRSKLNTFFEREKNYNI